MEKLHIIAPFVPVFMLLGFINFIVSRINGRPFLDIAEILNTVNRVAYQIQDSLVTLINTAF